MSMASPNTSDATPTAKAFAYSEWLAKRAAT
jgi:hypothetical protein